MVAAAVGCNPEPKESSIEFASKTYGYNEDQVYGYVGLMELNTPESFPVVVDVKATFKAGKDHEGNALTLKQLIAFDRGDEESYTVAYPDDNTAIISGIEVTYSQYNKKLYFSILDNDFLQRVAKSECARRCSTTACRCGRHLPCPRPPYLGGRSPSR